MIVVCAFLAGMSFVLAIAACLAAHAERKRAEVAEAAVQAALTHQAGLLVKLANQDVELERMIRAVAAASLPPTIPHGQGVQILVPGPRTSQ